MSTATKVERPQIRTNSESEYIKTKKTDVFSVDPRRIEVEEGFNERDENNYGDIEGLAQSVVQYGVIEAVIGFSKQGRFIMTEGHRRLRACQVARENHAAGKPGFEDISKIELIPFRTSSASILDRLLIMGITGEGKQPLTDLEKARLYERMIVEYEKNGVKRLEAINEIVKSVGVSRAKVYAIISLSKLPEEIKTFIKNGEITASTVVNIARDVKNPFEQIKLVESAIANAKTEAEKTGKTVKKATNSNVVGLKPKSVKEKLTAVKEAIESADATNVRAKAFLDLMKGLDENDSIKKLAQLFL